GSLPHTITGASPSLDDNDNWFNLGNDVSLRANLGSGEVGVVSVDYVHLINGPAVTMEYFIATNLTPN
ncbi:hypothetical protein, partial [Klebsiella michiganensis]